jgi:6-phosphogluconolactonase/glucosamine-6-phosphate isomerase/deaminase
MSLVFKQTKSAGVVAEYLADSIGEKLRSGQRVLWLVPGGSAIAIAAEASRQLRFQAVPLENLVVSLTDERYGDVGHADSNWLQLQKAGLELPDATMLSVLQGLDMDTTVQQFSSLLERELSQAGFRIGLFGIGADGHTAGILPQSDAVAATQFAFGYDAGNFKRITMTPAAIAKLDEAVVYAMGDEKKSALNQLQTDLSIAEQPAQSLKQVPKVTIYNGYTGEAA